MNENDVILDNIDFPSMMVLLYLIKELAWITLLKLGIILCSFTIWKCRNIRHNTNVQKVQFNTTFAVSMCPNFLTLCRMFERFATYILQIFGHIIGVLTQTFILLQTTATLLQPAEEKEIRLFILQRYPQHNNTGDTYQWKHWEARVMSGKVSVC